MSRNKTPSEKILWERLKDKQLGVNFHAQKIILGYIADFWCPKAALVVEVDGSSHKKRKAYDRRRDSVMRKRGISVMRFTNEEVTQNPAAVVVLIKRRVATRMA
jgi:very-short-patch-repair endonuclease